MSLPETDQDIPIPKAKPPKPEFIEQPFQRVLIGPDDIIMVSTPASLSTPQAERIRGHLKEKFPNNTTIILDKGMTLGVVAKEDIPEPKEPEIDSSAARCSVCVYFTRLDDFAGHCIQQWTHLGYRRLGGKNCRFFVEKSDQ